MFFSFFVFCIVVFISSWLLVCVVRVLWVVGCLRASGGSRGLDACGALDAFGAGRPKYKNAARQHRCTCWGGRAADDVCAAVPLNLSKYSRHSR